MKLIPLRNRSTSMALGKCVLPTGKAKKAALLLFSVAVLLACGAAKVRGQSALDGFDPNANGAVLVVVVQPDGKILLGGAFTTLSPNGGAAVTRNHVARLNPDGTLDTAFDPNANNNVYAIAVQADGKILVGGAFNGANSIGGATRNYIARLDPTTGAPDSFDPSANGIVHAIALQADGKILVGGEFNGANSIGGATRNRLARLDATTGAADSFDPNGNNAVLAIAVQADSKIIVSGAFNGANSIGGATRNFIARLDATTGSADSFDPNAIQPVYAIAVQADGKILAGGFFTTIGGATRNYIARLGATTGLADSFNPNANAVVRAIVVQADGKILAGGDFSGTNGIGGQTRNRIARLNATTGLADSFNPNANALVYAIAVQADGKVLTGGTFQGANSIGGQTRNYLARLEADGQLDRTLSLGIVGDSVLATAVQPDAKILLGGDFTTVLGVTRNNIARLNADGTLDTAFNPNASSTVYAIAVQADGKILVGGNFSGANSIGGQARNYIARLDATTGLADSFDPNANDSPSSIVVQADGKILVGGFFFGANSIGGATRNRIARLDATTGLADSFDPNANSYVVSIAVQADGKILAGGNFIGANSIGGATRNRIARLDAATGLADSFDPNANNNVLSIAVQADGKILAGGGFTIIGGATRNYIARLDTITGVADSFDPNASGGIFGSLVQTIALQADGRILMGGDFTIIGGAMRNRIARLNATTGLADSFNPNANNLVYAIAVQADGKILTGGDFSSINGQARNRFARLSNDTAALQSLAVTQTTITWTRDGSSAQCARVTFESSTDNVNYATLGNGTAAGSNWTLTDLNFPTGQNFYIRARGYHRSGGFNGSESITESVRNAFIGGPTPTPTPTATASPSPTPTPTPTLTATPTPTPTPTPALVVISQVFGGGGNTGAPYQNDFIEIFNRGSTSVNVGGWSVQYAAATGISWSVTPLCTGGGCMLAPGQYRLVQEASGGAVGAPLPPPDVTGTISMSATTGKVALVTSITPLSGSGCPFAGSVVDFVGYGLTANCFEGAGFAPAPSNTTADLRGGGGCMDTDNNAGDFATGAPVPRNTSAPLNACMTPAPTPTPTPTPPALISIAGAVTYCTHPTPIPSVTLTLTGTSGGSTLSDGSGNYTFASLASGGSYTVTPTKSALTPGAMGIDTVDVVATRRHYLQIVLLAGCPLAAADVNGDAVVDTTDVVAIQRFYLGQTTGIANVGKYSFTPVNRTYPVVVSDQTAQNYDTLVFGDVAPDFIHVPEGSLEAAAGEGRSGEVAATVATVALPEIVVDQSRSNFIAAVKSSAIEAKFDR